MRDAFRISTWSLSRGLCSSAQLTVFAVLLLAVIKKCCITAGAPFWFEGELPVFVVRLHEPNRDVRTMTVWYKYMYDLAVSAPLLSHTPTPVGSLVKGGDLRDGEMLIIRGRQPTRHIPPPSDIPVIRPPTTQECYLPQPGSSGRSGRGRDSSPGNSPSRTAPEPGQRNRVLVDSLNQQQGK